ncbi:MAG TPA: FAD binding domain-containing protein [Magnetospirillaceae bacterium]|nr:FAD binding domain-containing protein [Magnetospirillaceae bacterium]
MRINEVMTPSSLGEALSALRRTPDAVLCAGGTSLFSEDQPEAGLIISLHSIPELRQVSRTDHYVEIGSMTTLAELLTLKEGFLPHALGNVIRGIGTFAVRNLATLGGNLSDPFRFRDCFPVLACMDALAEYRHAAASRWVNLNRLIDSRGLPSVPRGEILTRVRIPLAQWSMGAAHKLGYPRVNSPLPGLFVILARTEKRIISEIRIFHSCERALRSREVENSLIGRRVPLGNRETSSALSAYATYCSDAGIPESSAARFLSLLRRALGILGENTVP